MKLLNIRKKSTYEIKKLIEKTNMKFDFVVNEALNDYLPKIFIACPFTEEICTKKKCMDCDKHRSPASKTL